MAPVHDVATPADIGRIRPVAALIAETAASPRIRFGGALSVGTPERDWLPPPALEPIVQPGSAPQPQAASVALPAATLNRDQANGSTDLSTNHSSPPHHSGEERTAARDPRTNPVADFVRALAGGSAPLINGADQAAPSDELAKPRAGRATVDIQGEPEKAQIGPAVQRVPAVRSTRDADAVVADARRMPPSSNGMTPQIDRLESEIAILVGDEGAAAAKRVVQSDQSFGGDTGPEAEVEIVAAGRTTRAPPPGSRPLSPPAVPLSLRLKQQEREIEFDGDSYATYWDDVGEASVEIVRLDDPSASPASVNVLTSTRAAGAKR
jgi:hypothetical protein